MEKLIFCAMLSTSSGGISRILLLFINVSGLFNLLARYSWHFNLYSLGQNVWRLSTYVFGDLYLMSKHSFPSPERECITSLVSYQINSTKIQ